MKEKIKIAKQTVKDLEKEMSAAQKATAVAQKVVGKSLASEDKIAEKIEKAKAKLAALAG